MVSTGQLPEDPENVEPMPIYHYEVSSYTQLVKRLITYARNEAEALGQIAQAIQRNTDRPAVELGDIVLIDQFEIPPSFKSVVLYPPRNHPRQETGNMQESIWDAGNTVRGLLHSELDNADTPRVAILFSDLGDTGMEGRQGLSVVYRHQTGEDVDDLSLEGPIPEFDILCAYLPAHLHAEAFNLALRFLRVRRPDTFLLISNESVDADLGHIQERVSRLGYRAHGDDNVVVGMLMGLSGPPSLGRDLHTSAEC